MTEVQTRIGEHPLEPADAWQWLAGEQGGAGAVVVFTGQVRDEQGAVHGLFLEQYPAMSARALQQITEEVAGRGLPLRVLAWHRTGWMAPGETIVAVGVSAAHRGEAFEACECLMDRVKTEVPLWKKVRDPQGGEHWVEARERDQEAAARWW